ncbi:MAG: hypothetical protein RBR77_14065 [Thauera sp.]|jgi:hypothetical protein|nr:hypothetical protein [Thauera sp.]
MRYALSLALIALPLLSACSTTPKPYAPRIDLMRPSECLVSCPEIPAPTDGEELGIVLWTFDVIDAAGQCRRMHEVCRLAK